MFQLALLLFGCPQGSAPKNTGTSPTSNATGTAIAITEETWNDAGSCWEVRTLSRPSSDWPTPCTSVIDTGPRWAYDLFSDADGNCARLPVGCGQSDSFFASCDLVADCCDDAKLAEPLCP